MKNKEEQMIANEMVEIFNNMDEEILNKIPVEIISYFSVNNTELRTFQYDVTKPLKEQLLSDKTKGIIAYIYKEYICDEQEKEEYVKEYNIFLEKLNGSKIGFNDSNIFNKQPKKMQQSEMPFIPTKLKWHEKLLKLIKNIFKA